MHIKKAFTMIELVFVVVVLGIIAAVALPRFDSDNTQDAMDQILSDIRYTQHLALVDNVIDPTDPNWQRAFWSIRFVGCDAKTNWYYSIGSDTDHEGNIDTKEAAVDPRTGEPLIGACAATSKKSKIYITNKFGINNIVFTGGCTGVEHIGFDSFGRPHTGFTTSATPNYSNIMTSDCTITFTFPSGVKQIQINKETGYAFVVGQENQ
jgi:prepilin-type N-terminal cleavage/methylation domain-containing protein